jgi:hypothetical protein
MDKQDVRRDVEKSGSREEATNPHPDSPTSRLPDSRMKRRGILAAAGAAVAGIVAKQISQPVAAATGGTQGFALIIGANDTTGTANTGTQPTMLFNGVSTIGSYYVADAFVAASQSGNGVQGYAYGNGDGVAGYNIGGTQNNASGVYGSAGSGIGVYGLSASGVGVQGDGGQDGTFNTTGFPIGVRGSVKNTGYGVYGKAVNGFAMFGTVSGSGVGVHGESASGTGGTFQGGLAPLRLIPGALSARTLTTAGHQAGELYMTSDNRLFLFDGTNWREVLLAAPGSAIPPAAAARSSGGPTQPVQPAPPPRP